MDVLRNKCAALAFMNSCILPPPHRATSVPRSPHSYWFITMNHKSVPNKWPSAGSWRWRCILQVWEKDSEEGPRKKKQNFLIWDMWIDSRTPTSTGLVLKTAVANSAIWPLTWVFLDTEWGSLNSHPCQNIYKPEELCLSPLTPA